MSATDDHLRRWQAAGLLDDAAAEAIRSYERGQARAPEADDDRPGLLEAVVYLGVALAAVGAIILVGVAWDELEDWARVAVVGVPGILAVWGGFALRSLDDPGLRRGGNLAWLAATALLAGVAGVLANNGGWDDADVGLAAGSVASLVAIALWAIAPSHPQLIGIGGALLVVAIALGGRSDDFSPLVTGGALALFAAVGVALADREVLTPVTTAQAVAAGLFALGAFMAGFDEGGAELLGFLAAAVLVALSIVRGVLVYMVYGIGTGFVCLIATITRHVDDLVVASLLLMLIGAVMVAMVVVLARWKPWRRPLAPA